MPTPDLVIRSRRLVLRGGTTSGTVHVRSGRITGVGAFDDVPGGSGLVDCDDLVVMAGLVDTHVHVNEPGRTDWEGFDTATRAAAAGGVTTIVDMPLNSVPATTAVEGLSAKRSSAAGRCWVDVGFWGGVVPGNVADLEPLFAAGALGFKCFLVPSGIEEFPHVSEADLSAALPVLKRLGATLLVHAELPGPIAEATAGLVERDHRRHDRYLASRPDRAEQEAIALVVHLVAQVGARVHIVHLSSAGSLPLIEQARQAGVKMTVETCPHYLYFAAEDVPDGATQYKCAPPIRSRANREILWSAFDRGLIDMIVSDHSPSLPSLKCFETGDFARAWGGISSLQLGLSAVWTRARERGWSLQDLSMRMSTRPGELAGLKGCKGQLAPGYDADIVVWDPEATFEVDAARLHHRHPVTPYAGERLAGRVEMTFLRGAKVYDRGLFGSHPTGLLLERTPRDRTD